MRGGTISETVSSVDFCGHQQAQPAGPRPEASTSFGPRPCGFRNQPAVHRSPNISVKNSSYAALTRPSLKLLPRTRVSSAAAPPSLRRRRPSTLWYPSSIRGHQIWTRSAGSAACPATPSRSCSSAMRGARTSCSSTSIPQPRRRPCPASSTARLSNLPHGMSPLLHR